MLVLKDVFSEEECNEWIQHAESAGFSELSSSYNPSYRNNSRLQYECPKTLSLIWSRLADLIPWKQLTEKKHEWGLSGLNPRLRMCKYVPGQFFKLHSDGSYQSAHDQQSFLTCNIYLNGGFEGGETKFHLDNEVVMVKPERGMVVLFFHELPHEGLPVLTNSKYLLRTDVMYKRKPLHNMAKEAKLKEAFDLLKMAEDAEEARRLPRAEILSLFERGWKVQTQANNMHD